MFSRSSTSSAISPPSVQSLKPVLQNEVGDRPSERLTDVGCRTEMYAGKMRAFLISSSASSKLRNERVTSSSTSEDMVKRVCSPNSCASTNPAAPLAHE